MYLLSSKERGEREELAKFCLLKEIMSNSLCIAVVSIPNINILTKSTLQVNFKKVHTHDFVLYHKPDKST